MLIFHIITSLFGLSLQCIDNVVINIIGIIIIYQHVFVIYANYPRVPKPIIMLGALIGSLIGLESKNMYIFIPLLYSFLSKFPVYARTLTDQVRTVLLVLIITLIINYKTT